MSLPPAQKKAKLLQEKEESKNRVTSKKTQEELLMADYDSIDSSSSVGSGSNISTSLAYSQTTKSNIGAMSSIGDSADFLSDAIEELSQAEVSDLISFVSYRDYSPVNKKEESKEDVKTKKLQGLGGSSFHRSLETGRLTLCRKRGSFRYLRGYRSV